ncbi:dihydrofolate synthase/folylpolyglutamate synthase [Geomicrobium halophilum]|uniref:Dihydrofolate synthase/folylpolyglutamate synthase n=1 Tax=Geomicrobium halophilum TaxID=549000 RepID=A0A841PVT9_9BACL|nr:folylpolyglutamate synthase/dihydrofolate synthase family protein [Geomicrobium halophilum]MBB6448343.1 dihydrofolate synthase/folylpolyglutamate synthase [Geomicrobium halophilum]
METYEEVMSWLKGAQAFGLKPGLNRMEYILSALHHPERRLPSIHIGGTNGKGSTIAYLRSILGESGLNVGTFTSPYVVEFEERISVNGIPIHQDDLISAANAIAPHAEALAKTEWGAPTEFELLTAMAIWHFAKVALPDIVIWEVGLGGRLDATNVVHPLLAAITNVGRDHMHILGSEITEIASEKAGIIKQEVPVITTCQNPEAKTVIREQSLAKSAPFYALNDHFEVINGHTSTDGGTFTMRTPFRCYEDLHVALRGEHQLENGALAVMIAEYLRDSCSFSIDDTSIKTGLERAFWPGRLEKVQDSPPVFLDGAHNPEGIERLAHFLSRLDSEPSIHILTAVTKEKEVRGMFDPLFSLNPESFILSSFDHPRSADPAQLPLKAEVFHSWKEGLHELLRRAAPSDVIVITGSLFLISEVRSQFF